ncbi:tRNA 2-selenouridine(34) synthase MnmH [Clostridium sp. D2Q-11]|uniref:tRNA 2-selenouridine(34) synthase MnmH n=1 Tax=Anaeromonas frigoriresistens TaxID=2683708 RepID=A0A942ZA65_9FIRM|nr:tRNA 2-selenouridine(34) synthase MnmH [Anaeromonas frigoriresistens]MBS4539904.1 tRNA 2-selenouridine(34) synthase MnmH [Anaeromonas frigoriresistens]
MIKRVNYEDIVDKDNIVYIDVRSPKEYNEDTIPGAINIPILDNKEREEIGYTYKHISKDKAKRMGLEYASKKLVNFYDQIKEIINTNKNVVLFCYRGGMRSSSIAKILDIMNLPIYIIDGGYKEYRNFVINNLEKYGHKFKFIVLHGYTGVGKTKALVNLKNNNHAVLDLEKLAQNSGSVFGNIFYSNPSHGQKKFESLLLNKFMNFKDEYIFVESESKRIGNSVMPDFLYENIQNGYHILLSTNISNRVDTIAYDYLSNKSDDSEQVISAIKKLKKKLGNDKIRNLEEEFRKNNYRYVIKELMIDYYDPLYEYSINKVSEYDIKIYYNEENELLKKLISFKEMIKER